MYNSPYHISRYIAADGSYQLWRPVRNNNKKWLHSRQPRTVAILVILYNMYVNNTNILLLIYTVYNYDNSFGENKTKRTLIINLKETRTCSKYKNKVKYVYKYYLFLYQRLCKHNSLAFLTVTESQYLIVV